MLILMTVVAVGSVAFRQWQRSQQVAAIWRQYDKEMARYSKVRLLPATERGQALMYFGHRKRLYKIDQKLKGFDQSLPPY